ncbi:UNVERIFIED_CONTAM: hypothetical protein PYX00_008444 [Menopon gallinae]|uniref:AXH domain-containing protein n=1 Tax=Menopon gallinae TaxID=328185 RepID=A0AAW2HNB3_9NEOP
MISTSSLVLDGHHGLGPGAGAGGPHHMAFDPYLRGKLPGAVPEFLCPLPKPAPIVPRFNGQRTSPSQSPELKPGHLNGHPTTSASGPVNLAPGPVNLTSGKHEGADVQRSNGSLQIPHLSTSYTSRIFPPPGFHYPSLQDPYGSMYPSSYPSLLNRPTYINSSSLSPLERQYSPPQSSAGNSAAPFLQPYPSQNTPQAPPPPPPPPPSATKPGQSLLREKRPFKIPPGKEVNGKQRVLSSSASVTKRVTLPINVNNNNNLLPSNFTKGSLIQLANGELRRVEDVTTEELVSSAERCPAFRLDPSTVVRIEESDHGTVLLTLSYGVHKKTIEIESTLEHPYFVYGQGWASCSPERTMNYYGLQCHRLQVGDICISLSPR